MVKNCTVTSSSAHYKEGVPQSTKLGPPLFVITINHFIVSGDSESVLYVDDCTVLYIGDDPQSTCADEVIDWSEENDAEINVSKTREICIKTWYPNHCTKKYTKPTEELKTHQNHHTG